ncbi:MULTISPECIES: thioredoxin family protein [Pseudomonas aeruginosa group]|uniref:thioredoxin family protein n=1 Tax=Pseudomonas aeruginosa group TaxID=136841 RepID=UPI00071BBFD1|nr:MULTISPECIES: thioredoxin family protein [Pseudomonas aeruginosa group]KSC52718.1 thioredoxin [Pseudomonas paraeruginosa]KSL20199.1 thioredoxin [Pseudomonas aeruginosa]MBH8715281.1 thioredoxin family protein [Pseudomonas aeruginosa]MBI8115080.1 thioredoxin family protein [Pseudomonas aeruginosa]OKR41342.1 thiol reductase thioredoxin [Pseudomonas aeruginosa]
MNSRYSAEAPARDELDRLAGPTLVEFGTDWCGHCQAAQPLLAEVLDDYPEVAHLKIEDGPGRHLGRSFQVKLWPTFVFLRDGREVTRVVRPGSASVLEEAFESLVGEG